MDISMTHNVKNNNLVQIDLGELIDAIKDEYHKNEIEEIRHLLATGDDASEKKAKDLKTKIPLFLPCVNAECKGAGELEKTAKPTSLIQFDIDLKHNSNFDTDVEKAKLSKLPYVIYAMTSPSGGLKFAIKTNFHALDGNTLEQTANRFKVAYYTALAEVRQHVAAVYDNKMETISHGCFMTSDAEVFYNPSATEFDVGTIEAPEPIEKAKAKRQSTTSATANTALCVERFGPPLEEILPYINKSLGYKERLPIVTGAMSVYGEDCIPMLLDHFTKKRGPFEEQLRKIYGTKRYGSYGTVVNAAIAGGYKLPAPRTLASQKPQISNHVFEPQLTKEEGREFVEREIANFFATKQNCYLSMPCGLGKSNYTTRRAAESIESMPLVYAAPTHMLAEQQRKNFIEHLYDIYGEEKAAQLAKRVKHIYGATSLDCNSEPLCKQTKLRKRLNDLEAGLSVQDCFNCPHFSTCQYVHQFEDTDLARFMVTDNLFLPPSKWWHGVDITNGKKSVKTSGFEPGIIIVDEDSLKFSQSAFVKSKTAKGLNNVLNDLIAMNGEVEKPEIGLTIVKHQQQILRDYATAEADRISAISAVRYGAMVKKDLMPNQHFHILKAANDFIVSNYDPTYLKGMEFRRKCEENLVTIEPALVQYSLRKIHSYFEGKPTLFLDATANEAVICAAYPNVPFKKISVKFPDHVKVHQLTSSAVSKAHLSEKKNIDRIISLARSKLDDLNGSNGTVGVITYQNVPSRQDFWQYVMQEVSASVSGYFGGLRGSNLFEDKDVIIIVGRQKIDHKALNKYARAIFDKPYVHNEAVISRLIRMQDGRTVSLKNLHPSGVIEQAIYDHFCIAETIQMIGRARPFWGGPKLIIYCSNEALGGDVEITDFFSFDDGQYDEIIENAKELGVINIRKPKDRRAIGITEHTWRENREEVVEALTGEGGKTVIVSGVNQSRHKFSNEYIVFDPEKLAAMTANTNFTVDEVDSFTKLFG